MFNAFSKELLKRLKSVHKGLLTDCGSHELNDYFNDSQIAAIKKLEKLITKVCEMENPSTIIEAARKGDLEKLTKLLEDKNGKSGTSGTSSKSRDINAQNKLGYTALHIVVELHEDTVMAARLLEAGADPNVYCNAGRTPLEYAMDYELDELEDLLREYGAIEREERW
jgi:hypothetical protein